MEIAIIKRETTGSGPNTFNENETIAKYEIMDGAPVRGTFSSAKAKHFNDLTLKMIYFFLQANPSQ